jgi:molybdopterin synthase catalytic subunit
MNDTDIFEVTDEPLDVGSIVRRVVPRNCGATVTLDGYVRQFTGEKETLYLVYEAYEPMAIAEMKKLGLRVRELFAITHVSIVHRLGKLEIGETSVVIAVAAPHRKAAFAACEWLIKEVKQTVPIWKKEFYSDGSAWSAGEAG